MVKIFLFIELLGSASPETALGKLKALDLFNCKFANVLHLAEEKLVAQLDCESYDDAHKAILEKIAPVEGVVQTNIVAAIRPKSD